MKKTFLATVLALTGFSQVALAGVFDKFYYENDGYYEEEEDSPKSVSPVSEELLAENTCFWEIATGVVAQEVDGYMKVDDLVQGTSFAGEGFFLSGNLGFNFKRWWALYAGLDFSGGTGHLAYDGYREKLQNFEFDAFNLHWGMRIFPFRDDPELRGLFFGFEMGIGNLSVDGEDYFSYYVVNDDPVNYKIEFGHVWDISSRFSLGLKGYISFESYDEDGYYYNDEMTDLDGVSLGFLLTLTRR
ncbi:MAG: hypothetical protein MJZ05_11425 [Fibrobacter sp.]|nr:hypothetical protein [Fibrobacter sp.]